MRDIRVVGMVAVALCLVACNADTTGSASSEGETGGVKLRVHGLNQSLVDKVEVEFVAASQQGVDDTFTLLRQPDLTFNQVVNGIPVGPYTVTAVAYQGAVPLFASGTMNFTVTTGTSILEIFLFQDPVENPLQAPYITAVRFSRVPLVSDPMQIQVWAAGGDGSLTLTGTGDGAFDNANIVGDLGDANGATLGWTPAGPTAGDQDITLKVSDPKGNESQISIRVFVDYVRGDVDFRIHFNHAPTLAVRAVTRSIRKKVEVTLEATYGDPDAGASPYYLDAVWSLSNCATEGLVLVSPNPSRRFDVVADPDDTVLLEKADASTLATCTVTVRVEDDNPPMAPSSRTVTVDLTIFAPEPEYLQCDPPCGAGQICEEGICVGDCPAAERCGGITCVDFQTDEDNCGTCGNACDHGCEDGECIRIATDISARNLHTCAVLDDSTVSCWGVNTYRQLGVNDTTQGQVPVLVGDPDAPDGVLRGAQKVAVGGGSHSTTTNSHTCALMTDTRVMCWGSNDRGQLGDGKSGTSNSRWWPMPVRNEDNSADLSGIVEVAAGNLHSCARRASDNVALCWGANTLGQLGNQLTVDSSLPVKILVPSTEPPGTLAGIEGLAPGATATCLKMADTSARCWGNSGSLSTGGSPSTRDPKQVPHQPPTTPPPGGEVIGPVHFGFEEVSAYGTHSCGLKNTKDVYCWGAKSNYFLSGQTPANIVNPMQILAGASSPPLSPVASISKGSGNFTCAALGDQNKTARCWGTNTSRQLGTGLATTRQDYPTQVVADAQNNPLKGVVQIATTDSSSCFRTEAGDVYCAGSRSRVGSDPGATMTSIPVKVYFKDF